LSRLRFAFVKTRLKEGLSMSRLRRLKRLSVVWPVVAFLSVTLVVWA
jgi:hypothetical protein